MRYGSELPRIYTPPLRELTPETTLGYSVISFAEDILELTLFPWQRWLLIHMLELLPGGSLRFRTVVVLVARQNGKSTLSQIIALWFMYVYGVALVIGTAQDLDVAEEIWQGAVDFVEDTAELDELKESVIRVNGKKTLLLKTGERYKVKAANRRAGRGLSGDVILLDELREHQSWDAWGAVTKTTMARDMGLTLAMSNAGDATSVVLRYLRKAAHAALGDPDGINKSDDIVTAVEEPDDEDLTIDEGDDSLGLFEWSAPPGCSLRDRDGWALANPSMGYTINERTIAAACRTDPEWIFRTEVLCQWSEGTLEGPFPPGAWEAGTDETSSLVGNVMACIDVSYDRANTCIAFASFNAAGIPHVEIRASRPGTEWVQEWFEDPANGAGRIDVITGQARGAPVSALLQELRDTDLPVIEWSGPDLPYGCGAFYDAVRDNQVRHLPQPLLDVAAATAVTKPSGDGWLWNRRQSPTDISPLVAVTGAFWLLGRPPENPRSKYEDADLLVV